jgi:hypothetical protein
MACEAGSVLGRQVGIRKGATLWSANIVQVQWVDAVRWRAAFAREQSINLVFPFYRVPRGERRLDVRNVIFAIEIGRSLHESDNDLRN